MDRRRPQLASEDGFGIIEVLVSALLVVLVSLGVLAAVDAAGRTSDNNKARSAASNLATADQERLRSIPISQLTDLDSEATPPPIDSKTYTVRSQGAFVVGSGQSEECASSEAAPKYLKITSTVTWRDATVGNPNPQSVKQESLRAMPNGTVPGRGSLAVDIDGRNGLGLPDPVLVTITGPGTVRTGTTNDKGCVIFGFIPVGTYTVSFGKANHVEAKSPNDQNISESVSVAVDATASVSYQYDQAGTARVNYVTNTEFGNNTWTQGVNGTEFSIGSPSLGTPASKSFGPHSGATTSPAYGGNFPFTSPYEAWSGSCSTNRPSSGVGSMSVPRGGAGTATVREFRVQLTVTRQVTSTSSNNYATMPNDGRTTVRLYGAGCTADATAAWIRNTGSGSGTASRTANFSTYEAIVPWGMYRVCVAYNGSSSNNRARNYNLSATTTTAAGTTFPSGTTNIEVPYNQSIDRTCPT